MSHLLLQQNHVFCANNIVIKLIVKSRLIMSILTKMINYIHFDWNEK
jgi:hypothetical protein